MRFINPNPMSTPNSQQNLFAPVLRGLVVDENARHFRRMKNAIWLFLYLIVNVNKRTGKLDSKIAIISAETGIKEEILRNWLGHLKKHNYVSTQRQKDSLIITISKWRTVQELMSYCNISQNPPQPVEENDRTPIDNPDNQKASPNYQKQHPTTNKHPLAVEISQDFKDDENFEYYQSVCQKYPLELINKAFNKVKSIPDAKIRKSRGALFTYLIKKYASKKND